MGFNNSLFVFAFMPFSMAFSIILYYISKRIKIIEKLRIWDISIIIMSLSFYAWAFLGNVLFLICFIIFVFFVGKLIERLKSADVEGENKRSFKGVISALLLIAIIILIVTIIILKYLKVLSDSGVEFLNSIVTPIGISFITFSGISYLVDTYKGEHAGNIIDVALYISFFPKIVSGPIILWKEFNSNIKCRKIDSATLSNAIFEIVIGFFKKIVIADYFGQVISQISVSNITQGVAWLIALLYMFQIYFDFAGYSNIAIGLSRFMGFDFDSNFKFPYISTSITEFWRRWHITLGVWFKTYIYIPLGGNRKGKRRTLINNMVVMLISGVWHGVGLNYILWGILHGVCVVFEKATEKNSFFRRIPSLIKWAVTMFVVMIGWELFRTESLAEFVAFIKKLIGVGVSSSPTFTLRYYLTTKMIVMIIIAIIGSTLMCYIINSTPIKKFTKMKGFEVIKYIVVLCLLLVVLTSIVNSTYSPFIYFQY